MEKQNSSFPDSIFQFKGLDMNILITGAAGFIGSALALRLLNDGHRVWGIDNLNEYYDVNLKKNRLARLSGYPDFTFILLDLADRPNMAKLFEENAFDCPGRGAVQPYKSGILCGFQFGGIWQYS